MKLVVTILLFCCSLLIQERGLASVRTSKQIFACMVHKATTRSMTLSAPHCNNLLDELTWCDGDNDDEFPSVKRKTQVSRKFQNDDDLIFIKGQFTYVINPHFLHRNYSVPGTDKCIFQRVLRV